MSYGDKPWNWSKEDTQTNLSSTDEVATNDENDATVSETQNADDGTEPTTLVSADLTTIIDDCLLHIMTFLTIIDIVNLAATCTKLHDAAKTIISAKRMSSISIEPYFKAFKIKSLSSEHPFALADLEVLFVYFGDLVVELTVRCQNCKISRIRLCNLLKHCQHLETLRILNFDLTFDETHGLQNIIEQFENLNELNLLGSTGITNNWRRHTMNCHSRIEKLSLTARNPINYNFLNKFMNLSSLTIDFVVSNSWSVADLEKILQNNRHCLKHLKVTRLIALRYYERFGQMITADKLPNLDNLAIDVRLFDPTHRLIEHPHLRSLVIEAQHYNRNINAHLRTLSDNGRIEELRINHGCFDDATMEPPFTFNALQRLDCYMPTRLIVPNQLMIQETIACTTKFLKLMTSAQMPAIGSFELSTSQTFEPYNLLRFIDSKETLTSIRLHFDRGSTFSAVEFFRQIIGILNKPKRAFMNMAISPLHLGPKEVTYKYLSSKVHTATLLTESKCKGKQCSQTKRIGLVLYSVCVCSVLC